VAYDEAYDEAYDGAYDGVLFVTVPGLVSSLFHYFYLYEAITLSVFSGRSEQYWLR
jgi:hypothetical protein